jgi:ribosomal protein L44E
VLFRAEHFAVQAVCRECKVYGAIEVLASPNPQLQESNKTENDEWLKVRCRKCGHNWTMTSNQTDEPATKYH